MDSPPDDRRPQRRAPEIDGLRGWAALVVLLFHAFSEMLKFAVPAMQSRWIVSFLDGDLAVAVFFMLSGDALSMPFFQGRGSGGLERIIVKRYFRLTIPILLSCSLTYALLQLHADYHAAAAVVLERGDWLGQFLQFTPSLAGLLKYSLLGVYTAHSEDTAYNPFLWTMSLELIGSMLVFLSCMVWARFKQPAWAVGCITVVLVMLASYYALFFAGLLLGYARQQGVLERLLRSRVQQYVAAVAVAAVAVSLLALHGQHHADLLLGLRIVFAMVLVMCAYTQRRLLHFFSNPLSRLLGDLSFPLYLVHFQVIISLMSWMVIENYHTQGRFEQRALLEIAALTVLASLIAAWMFRRVERAVLRRADAWVLRSLT